MKLTSKNVAYWKVNTGGLTEEIMNNPTCAILKHPINIFRRILVEVGERAAQINDPILNALMCRLSIYAESDPYDKKNYNAKLTESTIRKGMALKKKL